MLWFERVVKPSLKLPMLALLLLAVSGCTVQPLNAVKPNAAFISNRAFQWLKFSRSPTGLANRLEIS